jgi:uncharacterized protein (UPF0332 family)
MKKLFFIFILFLSQNSLTGELDGKKIICEHFKEKGFLSVVGFKFVENKVYKNQIASYGSYADITGIHRKPNNPVPEIGGYEESYKYYTSDKEVSWNYREFTLNRETLVLKERNKRSHQCKIVDSDNYYRILNEYLDKLNKEIKKRMKNNKL